MKKFIVFSILVLGLLNLSFSIFTDLTKSKSKFYLNNIRTNVVIIKFKPEAQNKIVKDQVMQNKYNAILSKLGANKLEKIFPLHSDLSSSANKIDLSRFYVLNYSENISPFEAAKMLESNSLIEYAEPKFIRHVCFTPNDLLYSSQWALKKIQAEQAWDISKGDTNVVIGIVDTGIDWHHPDLAANIWINKGEIANNVIDDDHNGYVDDIRGWDFGGKGNGDLPTPDNDPTEDAADHGTHVAGIASAITNNNLGIASIGYKCKLMAVKVSQNNQRDIDGSPYILYGFEGIVYAADNGANIINCSWGGGGFSQYESDVIEYAAQKGALVVAAAGNISGSESGYNNTFYPAAYNHVMSVAATDNNDQLADFSYYGPYVNVTAPGVNIYSTWYGGEYTPLDGTSMASPFVAGLAGLVKAHYPNLTPDQIKEKIRVSSDNIDALNPYYKNEIGFGRVNAYKALSLESPAVRMLSFSTNDTVYGNGNGILEPGEKIALKMDFVNYLGTTSNLSINLKSNDPYVTINKGSLVVGKISALQRFNNYSNPFEITINNSVPYDYISTISIVYSDGTYSDLQQMLVSMNQSFVNSNTSNIELTISSAGNLGFNDYPDNSQGVGFIYNHNSENLLFEGALLMGTSSKQISSAARGKSADVPDRDFKILKSILFSSGKYADEQGVASFNDNNSSTPMNVNLVLNTYSYKSAPYNNFIILNYNISNNNPITLNNFYAGLFFDWDIGPNGDNNIARYDHTNKIGYAYNQKRTVKTYTGAALLNNYDKENFYAILNDDPGSWQIYNGFTTSEKFSTLSSSTKKDSSGPGDISFVIGNGPFNIPAGGTINISFALLAGDTLSDLINAAKYAREKYNTVTLSVNDNSLVPDDFRLYQNYPNPFNPSTTIKYTLKENGNVDLLFFDIKGSKINEITRYNQQPGEYNETLDFSKFASGVYFYRLSVSNSKNDVIFTQSRRMILLK